MAETIGQIMVTVFSGVVIGFFFYGGLWWTVSRGTFAPMPALWYGVSLLLRTAIVAAGFLLAAHGSSVRALCCLFGFIAVRLLLTKILNPRREAVHAP